MPKPNTQERFARMVFISQPEVSQLIRKGVLTRGASLKQWYKEYLDNLRKVAQGWSSRDGLLDRIQEAALLDRRKREELEIKLAERKAELIPLEALKETLTFLSATIRTKLLGLPNRLKSQSPTMTAKQVAIAEEIVREILNELGHARFPSSIDELAERYFSALHTAAEADNRRVGRPLSDAQSGKQRGAR
jgi:phage terminase Nu1 subunit (DNA packaging protein)